MRVNYVIFDFAGTLAILNPSREKILKSLLERVGISNLSDSEISNAYSLADSLMVYSSVEESRNTTYRDEFYSDYNRFILHTLRLEDLIQINEVNDAFQSSGSHWEPAPDAMPALNRLTQAGVPFGVLSNFGEELSELITKIFKHQLKFSHVVDSSSIGLEKPNVEFFEYLISLIGCHVHNCVFVGDSVTLDYEPAMKLGIETYLVDRTLAGPSPSFNKFPSLIEIVERVLSTSV